MLGELVNGFFDGVIAAAGTGRNRRAPIGSEGTCVSSDGLVDHLGSEVSSATSLDIVGPDVDEIQTAELNGASCLEEGMKEGWGAGTVVSDRRRGQSSRRPTPPAGERELGKLAVIGAEVEEGDPD